MTGPCLAPISRQCVCVAVHASSFCSSAITISHATAVKTASFHRHSQTSHCRLPVLAVALDASHQGPFPPRHPIAPVRSKIKPGQASASADPWRGPRMRLRGGFLLEIAISELALLVRRQECHAVSVRRTPYGARRPCATLEDAVMPRGQQQSSLENRNLGLETTGVGHWRPRMTNDGAASHTNLSDSTALQVLHAACGAAERSFLAHPGLSNLDLVTCG